MAINFKLYWTGFEMKWMQPAKNWGWNGYLKYDGSRLRENMFFHNANNLINLWTKYSLNFMLFKLIKLKCNIKIMDESVVT